MPFVVPACAMSVPPVVCAVSVDLGSRSLPTRYGWVPRADIDRTATFGRHRPFIYRAGPFSGRPFTVGPGRAP